jgi:hypothetical protein
MQHASRDKNSIDDLASAFELFELHFGLNFSAFWFLLFSSLPLNFSVATPLSAGETAIIFKFHWKKVIHATR